ncbi:hypothetical protein GQX73_g1800 [Xylaria multiplex]|uniref:Methyltransferase type 11 domain-containing protein n=1 Tax=Xylaria multiplex TaxID=323545 RepID=A0A7C8MU99_9PEZI|nr:hypothetical protein GQX73_g1800 [Xylaria multiplex]
MQPLYGSASCAVARSLARNYRLARNIQGFARQSHEGFRLIRRQASSKAQNPSKKSAAKPLPYQPTQPRAQPKRPAQQQQQKQSEKSVSDLVRERWFAILGFGSALGCLGYFTASLAMYWRSDPAPCYPLGCEPEEPTGRPSIQSPYEFDLHLDKSEWRYGITRLRRELGAAARGHVLEVAIGTGRNLEFYPWGTVTESLVPPEEREKAKAKSSSWIPSWGSEKSSKATQENDGAVLSFTGVDISPGMLDITLQRMRGVVPHMTGQIPKKPSFAMLAAKHRDNEKPQGSHVVSFLSDRIRLLQSDVQSALPVPPTLSSPSDTRPPTKYDTILQTFGLCSVKDPVALLSLMASSLQPNTGRIILLEHGRSIWDFVNGLLDRGARAHHQRFGCWWNRDIEVIVNEAARRVPGLEILRVERPGWATAGTHVVVELRMRDASTMSEERPKEQKVTGWASIFSSILSTKAPEDPKKSN